MLFPGRFESALQTHQQLSTVFTPWTFQVLVIHIPTPPRTIWQPAYPQTPQQALAASQRMRHMPIKSQQWNARLSGCDTDLTLFQTFWPDKSQNQKSYEVPGLEGQDQGPAQIPGMFLREAGRGRRDKPPALCRQAAFQPLARGSLPGEDVFHAGDETCVADLFFLHYSLADHPNLRMFCVAMLLLHLSIFSFVLPAPLRVTSSNQSRLHHLAGI